MNRRDIERALIGNGHLIREARLRRVSLPRADRAIIGRVRQSAVDAGFSRFGLNALEMEGEMGARGLVAAPCEAVFKGLQHFSWLRPFRLYDIKGDHPLNNSTVGTMTLVHQWILPSDISRFQLAIEYMNEALFLAWCQSYVVWDSIKATFERAKNAVKRGIKSCR